MIRIGTPKNIEGYVKLDYKTSSLVQQQSIFPIWRDNDFMYFERTDIFMEYIRKEKLIDG